MSSTPSTKPPSVKLLLYNFSTSFFFLPVAVVPAALSAALANFFNSLNPSGLTAL